jgi:GAF domain-containing protein
MTRVQHRAKGPFDLKELGTPTAERVKVGETDRNVERRARSGRELKLIESVSELLRESTDTRDFLNQVVGFLADTLPRIDRAAIFLFDSETLETKDVVSQPRQIFTEEFMTYSREALDRVLREMKAVMVQDASLEKPALSSTEGGAAGIKSVMCVPVTAKSKLHGAIYVDGIKESHAFRKDDFSLVNCLTGPLGLAIENAQLTAKLSSIAGILSGT